MNPLVIGIIIVIGFLTAVILLAIYNSSGDNGSNSSVIETFTGHITDVIDGDTVEIAHVRIRLSLTSTPELNQDGGVEAKEFTTNLCPLGSIARVIVDGGQPQDQYGRTVAKVYCGDVLLNSELLEYGLATIDKRFCSVTVFASEDWVKKYGC